MDDEHKFMIYLFGFFLLFMAVMALAPWYFSTLDCDCGHDHASEEQDGKKE